MNIDTPTHPQQTLVASKNNTPLMIRIPRFATKSISSYLQALFDLLANLDGNKEKIIVLIDEYDNVFHDHHYENSENKQKHVRFVMQFYKTLKRLNEKQYIRSVFVTGITNLFKTNDVSPLAGWEDFSFDPSTADLIGFTEQEILSHYSDEDLKFVYANEFKCDINSIKDEDMVEVKKKVMEKLKSMYDGYRFTTKDIHVFNSESILKCFQKATIKSYWPKSVNTQFQWRSILKSPKFF